MVFLLQNFISQFAIKKTPTKWRSFYYLITANYLLNLAYLVLNLSIRPAVSTNLVLPV
jgi:hypothetical protein